MVFFGGGGLFEVGLLRLSSNSEDAVTAEPRDCVDVVERDIQYHHNNSSWETHRILYTRMSRKGFLF